MRIGIEMRHITAGVAGGITPLVVETLSRVFQLAPRDQFHLFGTIFNQDLFSDQFPNVRRYSLPFPNYWQHVERFLNTEVIDVLFRCYPADDPLEFPLSKQVTLVPDLQHEKYPEFFSDYDLGGRRRSFTRLLRGSGAVGTISEYARSTIQKYHPNRFNDIFLMPPASQLHGAGSPSNVRASFAEKVRKLRPYFFYPANAWPHKNHTGLVRAFQEFRRSAGGEHNAFSLILSGHPRGWDEVASGQDVTGVSHVGFVSREEVRFLYENATALVFLSLYEGFGIPVLEAFGLDCPVLCSNVTSLPEIVDDAALVVEPTNLSAVVAGLRAISEDEGLRRRLIEAGRSRLKNYSWEKSAHSLHRALVRVHERKAQRVFTASRPLVSIVTPSLNQGRFIRDTIESVLSQTYPHIEYRVVDGGSTDETLDVLRSYGTKLKWESEPDRGQAHAINKGFAQSRGEICGYLNSDDVLLPDAVATVVSKFLKNTSASMLYGDAHYIDAENRITGSYATADYSFERLMQDCCICQPAAFWTKEIADKIGPFDEKFNYALDYDYWLRIDRAGGLIQYIQQFLANSRLHPATKTLSHRRKIYDEIFSVCERHGGYVSRSYVEGYWYHRFHERPDWFTRWAKLLPNSESRIVEYHAQRVGRPALSHMKLGGKFIANALRRRIAAVPQIKNAVGPTGANLKPVEGFWSDGWLARRARFASSAVRTGQRLQLRGCPIADCAVTITNDGHEILSKELVGGVETEINFIATGESVELTFTGLPLSAVEGRDCAFFLIHTNLFAEHELESYEYFPVTDTTGVSVVVPSYNQGRFIDSAIKSLLDQGYPRLEIIVVDGGSKDDTVERLNAYGKRISWISEPDKGQTDALIKGFARATNPWLVWLNSDDIQCNRALWRLNEAVLRNPGAQVVIGKGHYISEDGSFLEPYPTIPVAENASMKEEFFERGYVAQPSVFFAAALYHQMGGLNRSLQYCMDYELWCRFALANARFVGIDADISGNRVHPDAKSSAQLLELLAEVAATQRRLFGRVSHYYVQGISDYLYWHLHGRHLGDVNKLIRQWLYFKCVWLWLNMTSPRYCLSGLFGRTIARTGPITADFIRSRDLWRALWQASKTFVLRRIKKRC